MMELLDSETFVLEQDLIAHASDTTKFRERHLMVAVLRDAIECCQKYAMARHPRGRALYEEAVAWIESTDREWPFSYENICDMLGIDSGGVRRSLVNWGQQRAATTWRTPRIVPLFPTGEGDDAQVG